MGHGVQRRQRGDGQAAGPTAARWPAAARSAAGQREIPTCSASLLLPARRPGPGRPALMCGLLTALSCASVALPTTRLAHRRACPSSSRHYPHRGTLIATPERLILARCGDEMRSCSSWQPGRVVIRTLPPPPPHHVCRPTAPPPGDHAVKLTSHVPGRDHVTGPDQIRAHTGRRIRPTPRNLCACLARFPPVVIRTSAMKGPGPAGLGSRRTRGRALPSRVFTNLCCRRDEAPGPHRRHSASSCQQLMRARHAPAAGFGGGADG
jgi:hypothetical protein